MCHPALLSAAERCTAKALAVQSAARPRLLENRSSGKVGKATEGRAARHPGLSGYVLSTYLQVLRMHQTIEKF